MNVSSQSLRRRQSSSVSGAVSTLNRPPRRVGPTFKKRKRSSQDLANNPSSANEVDVVDVNDAASVKIRRVRDEDAAAAARPRKKPLSGVVVCLSGQANDVKHRVHRVLAKLGGTTMGRFDPRHVTHLVLDAPEGSKYENWRRHRSDGGGDPQHWAERLMVVTTSWADACGREGRRVPEEEHGLASSSSPPSREKQEGGGDNASEGESTGRWRLPTEIRSASSEEKCDWMIRTRPADDYRDLFSRQSFVLAGFDDDDDDDDTAPPPDDVVDGDGRGEVAGDGSLSRAARADERKDGLSNNAVISIRARESETLKGKVSKLIRRAGGTIFWEPNEWITTVLMNDVYSKRAWDDARYFCREHPRRPVCVGVDWVLTCIYHRTRIASPPFPAEPRLIKTKKRKIGGGGVASVGSNSTRSVVSKPNKKSKQSTSSLFRGDVFFVAPLRPLPGTLDFRWEEMESVVVRNGGMLLSKSLLLAIKKDARYAAATENANPERKYYVVTPRRFQLDCATSFPLLAELAKVGIRVLPVSPVWVAACTKNRYKYDPEEYPVLFQPQTWSIRLWTPRSGMGERKRLISVTGFVDSSRYGIVAMLKEVGAEFTDSLSRRNTHLICKEARGAKFAKAMEWGLHAVSLEWLYHVMRRGYEEGSENEFSLVVKKEPAEKVGPSLDGNADAPIFSRGNGSNHFESANGKATASPNTKSANAIESEANSAMYARKVEPALEYPPPSQSTPRRRSKRDPPHTSPKFRDPPQSEADADSNDRYHCALRALEAPVRTASGSPRRRGKRDKSPVKALWKSTPPPSQRSCEDEDDDMQTETETQFTTGTLRANADIFGGVGTKRVRGDSSEVPASQANDAEEEGESQVVWFAAPRV